MNPHFNHKHHRRNEIKFPTTSSSELPSLELVETLSTEYNNPIQQRATNTFGGVSTYENLHYNTQPNDDVVTTAAAADNNARHNKNTNFQPHYDDDLLRRQRQLGELISSSQSVRQWLRKCNFQIQINESSYCGPPNDRLTEGGTEKKLLVDFVAREGF